MDREIGVGGFAVSPLARRYVNEALDSNRLSYGPFHRRFEAAFAAEHDSKHAVFCNSGTSALQIALQALKEKHGWADGDEVIVPSVTFIATSNIVLHNRMVPVFADVDPLTYTLDPAKFEAAITPKPRAVIPVHLLGLPADMDPIIAIARKHGLAVIEDSAETMFACYKGRKVGSLGDIGCFSTYIAHYIVTGVGGLATTSDPDLCVRLRSLMNHGRDSIYLSIDDDKAATGKKLHEIVSKRFQFVSVGHSYRATELEAALGLAQLEE
ncbi:MAG: aminotransferase DegT, partial [Elusimicrobia bacterium CG11_big_fil_rev_8_21_14_0_20_64_6]